MGSLLPVPISFIRQSCGHYGSTNIKISANIQADVLQKILRFSPSDHPLTSIISRINDMEKADERAKFVNQILDKFFQSLNDGSVPLEGLIGSKIISNLCY